MLIEKSKNKEELKENLEKIVQEVSINPNIYTKEQVEILINIMKYILINKVEKKEIEKLIRILRGDKNMLAVLEMLEEEDRKTFNKGKKEGKKEGKKKEKKSVAKKMIDMNIDMKIITEALNLSKKEILQIKKGK